MISEKIRMAEELEAEAKKLRDEEALVNVEPVRTPYLVENADGSFSVGARDEPQVGDFPYNGPCAAVSVDHSWLHIVTDDYEGHAMLNIEALPNLIEALQRLAKRQR